MNQSSVGALNCVGENGSPRTEISQLAARQYGNVTRRQLLAAGLGTKAIDYRVGTGELHPVRPGVYAVGRPAKAPLERAAAALLACGPTAALSHASAVSVWGLAKQWTFPLHVTITEGDRRPKGVPGSPQPHSGPQPHPLRLEDDFAGFCRHHDLPAPLTNVKVCGFEVDPTSPSTDSSSSSTAGNTTQTARRS